MEMPSVVHPKVFEINGILFQVVSYTSLTDTEAAKIARHFYRTQKFRKKDKGKLFQAVTLVDDSTKGIFS